MTDATDALDAILTDLIPRFAATQQLLITLLSGVKQREEIFAQAAQALSEKHPSAGGLHLAAAALAELDQIQARVEVAARSR